jgi:3D (Asp-Asp-Asp) domain-containing protein
MENAMTNQGTNVRLIASIARPAPNTPAIQDADPAGAPNVLIAAARAAAIRVRRGARAHGSAACLLLAGLLSGACATSTPPAAPEPIRLAVTATAYNSVPAQTDSDPTITAHGVRLEPGMRVIAVSRDLEALGLKRGTRVRIEGLPGEWTVADRMARRWRHRIDVYMGLDVKRALEFGRREVDVQWLSTAPTRAARAVAPPSGAAVLRVDPASRLAHRPAVDPLRSLRAPWPANAIVKVEPAWRARYSGTSAIGIGTTFQVRMLRSSSRWVISTLTRRRPFRT